MLSYQHIIDTDVSMEQHTPVLIVGAGPTGLMAANLLAQFGIDFRLIDSKSRATTHSNAVGIHARSLEVLQAAGMVEKFLESGLHIQTAQIYRDPKLLLKLRLKNLLSQFQYVLSLPQNLTEKYLTEALLEKQYKIERNTTLAALYPFDDHVDVVLEKHNSEREKLSATWVLACDGAHSTVRALANIDFEGDDFDQEFLLADISFKRSPPRNRIEAHFSDQSILFYVPLPNSDFRVITNLTEDHPLYNKKSVSADRVADVFQQRLNRKYQIEKINWHSFFWIHSKLTPSFSKDRIFLLGDAAHIHSPVGAQGMNTGFQDAFNLIWKLALVIDGKCNSKILDSYCEERKPIAEQIVSNTKNMTSFITSQSKFTIWLKTSLFRSINHLDKLKSAITQQLAQLNFQYKDSSIIDYSNSVGLRAPKPGMRFPNIKLHKDIYFFQKLVPLKFNMLIFLVDDNDAKQAQRLIKAIKAQHKNFIEPIIISTHRTEDKTHIYMDRRKQAKKLHIKCDAVYIIRPDQHIGYCQSGLWIDGVLAYLERFTV